jgi:hypothetical protein
MRVDTPGPSSASAPAPARRLVPAATALAIGLGALLRFPVLRTTFFSDDYQQLAMLHGRFLLARAPWDLFWFGPRNAIERRALLDFGFDPWWTAGGHTISMFRPLSSLLIWLDDRLFGMNAALCHAHSLLWWVALVLCAARLSSRVLPDAVAACAIVLFALDAAHGVPLSWLANRSTLVAATFGMLALTAHVAARTATGRGAARAPAAIALVGWACALAAGEYAFGMLAYLVAYEAFGARGPVHERVRALLPAAGLAALYLGARAALGYGAAASGIYVGPDEPLRFARAAATRVPALAADLLLGVPATWWRGGSAVRDALIDLHLFGPAAWSKLPGQRSVVIALGVAALALGALALHRVVRRAPELGALRWLAAGSFFGAIAASGTLPSTRLLVAPAFGASALLAGVVVVALGALRARAPRPRMHNALALGTVALAIALVHGALAARDAYVDSARHQRTARTAQRWALDAPIPRDAQDLDVIVISASDFSTSVNVPWVRAAYGLPLPRSYQRLSAPMQPHDVTRVDAHTLDVALLGNNLDGAFAGSLYRTRDDGLHAGQHARGNGFEVSVLGAEAGNPSRLRVRFDRALDDPRLLFLHARAGGLARVALPGPGRTLRLPVAAAP